MFKAAPTSALHPFQSLDRIPPQFRKYTRGQGGAPAQEKNSLSPQDFAFVMLVLMLFYFDDGTDDLGSV